MYHSKTVAATSAAAVRRNFALQCCARCFCANLLLLRRADFFFFPFLFVVVSGAVSMFRYKHKNGLEHECI